MNRSTWDRFKTWRSEGGNCVAFGHPSADLDAGEKGTHSEEKIIIGSAETVTRISAGTIGWSR